MRPAVGALTLIITAAGSLALADPPAQEPASAAPSAASAPATVPASAAPATTPAAAAPAANASAAAKDDPEEKTLRSMGYKPEMHGGTKVWCKSEAELGSRLATAKRCGTAAELAAVTRTEQQNTERMQRLQMPQQAKGQ